MALRVLITEPIAREGLDALHSFAGIEVVERVGLAPAALAAEVDGSAALLVRSQTTVSRQLIAAGRTLRVIGRAGAGVDNIDLAAAAERGIVVMNTPGANADAAAELTLALMFAVARHVAAADAAVKAGRWDRAQFQGTQLLGKMLGVIGIGHVGRTVARRAAALGMRVLAHDPYVAPAAADADAIALVSLDELIEHADYITVHTPLDDSSRSLIGTAEIARMKRGVYLINSSRGGIIDEQALLAALDRGQVAAAGLDVFTAEPPGDLAIVRHPRVVATPHIGAATAEAQVNVAVMIANQIGRFLTTGETVNAINSAAMQPRSLP